MNGVIIVDKPAGWTSHDVVNRMRRILGHRSVGHLGTLDPLAPGVPPLVTGGPTRLAQFYTTSEKTYEGTIRFGFATNTYDADGEPAGEPAPVTLSLEPLQQLAAKFQGLIEQVPPPFSAKKIHGVPASKLASKQQEVILKPVQVEIKEFAILAVDADRHLPRPRRLRHLHAFRLPRYCPATRLRSPSRISPPHRRRRIRYHPSPHPRRD